MPGRTTNVLQGAHGPAATIQREPGRTPAAEQETANHRSTNVGATAEGSMNPGGASRDHASPVPLWRTLRAFGGAGPAQPGTNSAGEPYRAPTLRAGEAPTSGGATSNGSPGLAPNSAPPTSDTSNADPDNARKQTEAVPTHGAGSPAATPTGTPRQGGTLPEAADTKYVFRYKREYDVQMGPAPAKLEIRLDASLKDEGSLHHGAPGIKTGTDVTWGNNEARLEQSAQGVDAKITTSVMKANIDLLADGLLPNELMPLGLMPKVEIKGFEAGLSLKKGAELKLMTMTVLVEGDFSSLFPDDTRSFAEFKGQVRIECTLDPDLAKKLIELARAADALKRAAEVEGKIEKTQRELKYWRRLKAKDKVKELERELSKLQKIRGGVRSAADAATKKVAKVGAAMQKSPLGRLASKYAGKALARVFKKFIPFYNAISTAQDIYEAGEWLAGVNWNSIGSRILDGGPGGTDLSDGSHDGEAGGGAGSGDSGDGDGGDVSADAIERELQQEANPQLHAAAKQILGVIEKQPGSEGKGTTLSKEDKETLNFVIPPDLSPAEIEVMRTRISTSTGQKQDLVTNVIAAVQQVRPLGEKRLGPASPPEMDEEAARAPSDQPIEPQQDQPAATAATAEKQKAPARPRKNEAKPKDEDQDPGALVVDPTPTLLRVIRVDEFGNVEFPRGAVQFPGFKARLDRGGVARYTFDTGEAGSEASYMVKVTIVPTDVRGTRFLRSGNAVYPLKLAIPIPDILAIVKRAPADS